MSSQPDTYPMSKIMSNMPKNFKPDRAAGVEADIQFVFSGEEPGEYVLSIHNGEASMREGTTETPTATIEAPSEVWKAISMGKTNAMSAFMSGQFKAKGDMGLLMRMQSMFPT